MKIKALIRRYLFILIIGTPFLYPLQEREVSVSTENWNDISTRLSRFLADPVVNFPDMKIIEDLSYWTNIYDEINGGSYIKTLFSRHFKAEDIDESLMDMIYYLLSAYTYPANWWDDYGIKPIIGRILEVIKAKPEWFFKDLVKRDCWKDHLKLILRHNLSDAKSYLDLVSDASTRQEILSFIEIYEDEKRTEVPRLEAFLIDPANNFDKIKDIYSICSVMYIRNMLYLDENKNLAAEYDSVGIIENYIRESPDGEKIKILIHLLLNCNPYGREAYVFAELGSEMFYENTELFARSLSGYRMWRSILYSIHGFLYYRDPGYKKVIGRLGNTEFEKKLREELVFLSSLAQKKHKKIHEN